MHLKRKSLGPIVDLREGRKDAALAWAGRDEEGEEKEEETRPKRKKEGSSLKEETRARLCVYSPKDKRYALMRSQYFLLLLMHVECAC